MRRFTAADLVPGKQYRVVIEFTDYDSIVHPIGETWRFLAKDFLPYDDGLTLYVEREGQRVPFRLQWRAQAQARIIDQFSDLVEEP